MKDNELWLEIQSQENINKVDSLIFSLNEALIIYLPANHALSHSASSSSLVFRGS